MEKIKDYINVTIFKNRKPTYDYSRQFTVGDRGIIWKITFAYDYGLSNLHGKIFQIQYILPNNGLYIDEFEIDTNGIVIERRIDDRCFYNLGVIKVKFAIKDYLDDTYMQIPYELSVEVKQEFICSQYLTAPIQELMIDGLIQRAIMQTRNFVEKDMRDIIQRSIDKLSKDSIQADIKDIISEYMSDTTSRILQIEEKYKNKTIEPILFSINDCDIYNYSISELYDEYFVKVDNMYINYIANKQIPDNLHDIFINKIIDIEKQNGYNKLDFEKNKILQECIGVYCMELEYKYDSTPIKLKEWYNNELHKIDNYTNLSKKLEIYPYEVIFE